MNILYCDSSLKEYCIVYTTDKEHVLVCLYMDKPTVNEGEYRAVLAALDLAFNMGWSAIEIRTDSQFVTRQVSGRYKCKKYPHLIKLLAEVHKKMKNFYQCKIIWLHREENKAGKILEEVDALRKKSKSRNKRGART